MDSRSESRGTSRNVGVKNPCARLTEDDVRAIRASNETQRALGEKYGVSHTAIYHIKKGIHWSHVE